MKTTLYGNGIKTKLHNKKIVTSIVEDDTFYIEITKHFGNVKLEENDVFAIGKRLRGNVLYGNVRVSRESLEVIYAHIGAILDYENFKKKV